MINRRIILITISLAFVLVLAGYLLLKRRSAPGKLEVAESLIVWQGKTPLEGGQVEDGAAAIFECKNTGHTPVRILSTESGCGCAIPTVEPTTIEPGQGGVIRVQAVPFPLGERTGAITLNTDSTITPTVSLTLRMVGSQSPPFLVTMIGDLTFLEEESVQGESREIQIIAVEPVGRNPRATTPEPRSDLPFLHFERPTVETKPYVLPDTVQKIYTYRVTIASELPAETFSGEVSVMDPWIAGHKLDLKVFGRPRDRLKAVPTTLTLSPDSVDREILRILSDGKASEIQVESILKDKSSLLIERLDPGASERIASFAIRARPGRSLGQDGEILTVHSGEFPSKQIRVPVLVPARGRP